MVKVVFGVVMGVTVVMETDVLVMGLEVAVMSEFGGGDGVAEGIVVMMKIVV